jgi:hypothetical protein
VSHSRLPRHFDVMSDTKMRWSGGSSVILNPPLKTGGRRWRAPGFRGRLRVAPSANSQSFHSPRNAAARDWFCRLLHDARME